MDVLIVFGRAFQADMRLEVQVLVASGVQASDVSFWSCFNTPPTKPVVESTAL